MLTIFVEGNKPSIHGSRTRSSMEKALLVKGKAK